MRPGYDYLAHRKIGGLLAAAGRGVFAGDVARFATTATDLDYGGHVVKRVTERVVVRLLIQTGRGLDELVTADVDELATALQGCAEAKGNRSSWVNDRALVLAAHRVLFHLGVLATPPQDPRRRPGLAGHYSGVDEPLRTLLLDYCEQAAATRAPATVKAIASHLAGFGRFLSAGEPPVTDPAALDRRAHIEAWLAGLAAAQHPDGRAYSVGHRRGQILTVRQFLADITEWGWPAAPPRADDLRPGHPGRSRTRCPATCPGRRPPLVAALEQLSGVRADRAGPAARRRAAAHPRHRAAPGRTPNATPTPGSPSTCCPSSLITAPSRSPAATTGSGSSDAAPPSTR